MSPSTPAPVSLPRFRRAFGDELGDGSRPFDGLGSAPRRLEQVPLRQIDIHVSPTFSTDWL